MRHLSRSLDTVVLWVRTDEEDQSTFFWRAKGGSAGEISCFKSEASPEPKSGWRVTTTQAASLPACLAMSGPQSQGTYYFLARR